MDTFGLKIIASDKVFYEGRCINLILPASDGEIGILANHENAVIALGVGDARLEYKEGQWMEVALGEGFAEIINNRVTVLVSTAERPDEIDILRAEEAKERAEERLRQKQSTQEYYQTQAALARAMNRLKISQRK